MKILVSAVVLVCLVNGCQKKPPTSRIPTSLNATLPDLPIASAAKKIEGDQIHFIEVQYSTLGWNVQGGVVTEDHDEIEEQIKEAKDKIALQGYHAQVLIEADRAVAFKKVRHIIRTSAKAGVDQFLFCVKQHKMHPDSLECALTFDISFYSFGGCGPALEPLFIKSDRKGLIYIHSGAAQELVESELHSSELQELSRRLELYKAAARAGAQEPLVQVWIDSEAPYQRFIDLINLFRSHGISREIFTDILYDGASGIYGQGGCAIPMTPMPPRKPVAPKIKNPITY